MKLLMILMLMFSFSAMAMKVTGETRCYTIKDEVDRDYCKKKKMSILKKRFTSEQSTWKKGISKETKNKKSQQITLEMAEAQEMIEVYQQRLGLLKNHQEVLAKTKVLTPKKRKKKKKKKKKKRSDLEKALNIKL